MVSDEIRVRTNNDRSRTLDSQRWRCRPNRVTKRELHSIDKVVRDAMFNVFTRTTKWFNTRHSDGMKSRLKPDGSQLIPIVLAAWQWAVNNATLFSILRIS